LPDNDPPPANEGGEGIGTLTSNPDIAPQTAGETPPEERESPLQAEVEKTVINHSEASGNNEVSFVPKVLQQAEEPASGEDDPSAKQDASSLLEVQISPQDPPEENNTSVEALPKANEVPTSVVVEVSQSQSAEADPNDPNDGDVTLVEVVPVHIIEGDPIAPGPAVSEGALEVTDAEASHPIPDPAEVPVDQGAIAHDELARSISSNREAELSAQLGQISQSEESFHTVAGVPVDRERPASPPASSVLQPSPPTEQVSIVSRHGLRDQEGHRPQSTPVDSNFPSYLGNVEVYSTSQPSIQVLSASDDGQTQKWEDMISDSDDEDVPPVARPIPTLTSTWPTTTEASARRTNARRSRRSRHSRHSSYPVGVDAERIEAILQASMQQITRLTTRIEGIEGRLEDLERILQAGEVVTEFQVPSFMATVESRDLSTDYYREPMYLRAGAILVGMGMLMGASHLARRGLI